MSKSQTRQSPLPPSFSTLHAKQDSVLVCTKKDGTIENFDYVPLEDVKVNGMPLNDILWLYRDRITSLESQQQKDHELLLQTAELAAKIVTLRSN